MSGSFYESFTEENVTANWNLKAQEYSLRLNHNLSWDFRKKFEGESASNG